MHTSAARPAPQHSPRSLPPVAAGSAVPSPLPHTCRGRCISCATMIAYRLAEQYSPSPESRANSPLRQAGAGRVGVRWHTVGWNAWSPGLAFNYTSNAQSSARTDGGSQPLGASPDIVPLDPLQLFVGRCHPDHPAGRGSCKCSSSAAWRPSVPCGGRRHCCGTDPRATGAHVGRPQHACQGGRSQVHQGQLLPLQCGSAARCQVWQYTWQAGAASKKASFRL